MGFTGSWTGNHFALFAFFRGHHRPANLEKFPFLPEFRALYMIFKVAANGPWPVWLNRQPLQIHPGRTCVGGRMCHLRRLAMGKKLYVGNLSYDVDSSELEQLFGNHGQVVSAQIINDRDTGRSKGFGFVEMSSDEQAEAAIAALNGQQHNGRALTVNEARPKEDRGGGGGFGGGRGGERGGGRDRGDRDRY
jgi:hypothetical protein